MTEPTFKQNAEALDALTRDHRRVQWLTILLALLALVVGVLIYLAVDESTGRTDRNRELTRAAAAQALTAKGKADRTDKRTGQITRYLQGKAGLAGVPGKGGVVGAPGPIGAPGPTGAAGKGIAGAPGPFGPVGPAGPVGPQGLTGLAGQFGQKGDTGQPGQTGDTGAQGDTGPEGPQGPQGETGPQGEQGPPPDSFTFTFAGQNFTCTDSNGDGDFECN